MRTDNPFSCWLFGIITVSTDKRYRHHFLSEQCDKQAEILEELKIYVQRAHEDAKYRLRKLDGYTVDPLNFFPSEDPIRREKYPEALHIDVLKGCFGEVLAGLVAEYFSPFGIDEWKVPAFLFRFHLSAFQKLGQLSRPPGEDEKAFGRTGDDCLAFQLDKNGDIVRLLYCEAKCTASHRPQLIADAHAKVSSAEVSDLSQLIDVLLDRGGSDAQRWVWALRRLRNGVGIPKCERYDLVNYVYGSPSKGSRLSDSRPHENYIASRKLEAVEIHLCDVEGLVREVYDKKEGAGTLPSTRPLGRDEMDNRPDRETIELAQGIREQFLGTDFPSSLAKLYSQHRLLGANQKELKSWQTADTMEWLHNAVRLIDAGFIERDAGKSNWSDTLGRAGEILEWLSHPDLNPDDLPLRLLSAAAYQLAGYPARARGLLNEELVEGRESAFLRFLLKAELPDLFQQLVQYWRREMSAETGTLRETDISGDERDKFSEELQRKITTETMRSLGILCAEMRWGGESRLQVALEQLKNIGKIFLHTDVPYSWLLAKLCTEVVSVYAASSMRYHLATLAEGLNSEGKETLERYLRDRYRRCKSLAWSSQIHGIEQLTKGGSFALCTPTGSGKTTVAEIAIMQSLFPELSGSEAEISSSAPLALYLVPSKALATEVESGLSRAFRNLKVPPIIVTSLYGGTDGGPTDAWFILDQPTVLICTYEKSEALIRFLGSHFLKRVSLIIIDEAHSIQFDGNSVKLCKAESRSLHLEAMSTRLFAYLDRYQKNGKVVALSAVASDIKEPLARWIAGQTDSVPVETSYRSTRQVVGRLECLPDRSFKIYNDWLDGATLHMGGDSKSDVPYIPRPFPACPAIPEWENKSANQGPEKCLRPYLLWAAMQLASPDDKGRQGAVLVSVTQQIGGYAKDFLELLTLMEKKAQNLPLFEPPLEFPLFFQAPVESKKQELWGNCLQSCEDYFGPESVEYKLLRKGIVVHHGKMPGLLARFLVKLIDKRVVHLVLATSTLSEGVNLPFETILIPSLRRVNERISNREFGNLIGRAGRPGFGTEGRSLVLLDSKSDGAARSQYTQLIANFNQPDSEKEEMDSSLATLLSLIHKQWGLISKTDDHQAFLDWLDQTAPLSQGNPLSEGQEVIQTLDSLDGILLSMIVEIEQLTNEELSIDELERHLTQVWRRSFAYYSTQQEQQLGEIFVMRGMALKKSVYQEAFLRRRLYRTGMPPRSGSQLLLLHSDLKEYLKSGEDFARRSPEERFWYVRDVVDQLRTIPILEIAETLGEGSNKADWESILRWWLAPKLARNKPSDSSKWYDYVSDNFIYRLNWGLGSVVSLAIDDAHDGNMVEASWENWSDVGLPWIVLWLKELITWGTLEPVAAYLLARGVEVTRKKAEKRAELYYLEQSPDSSPDELLNAVTIREWAMKFSRQEQSQYTVPPNMKVYLARDFSRVSDKQWRVIPVEDGDDIYWFDPGGFHLASCQKPENWHASYMDTYDFMLDPHKKRVWSISYV
jgi:DEAD/DEAH box helicase